MIMETIIVTTESQLVAIIENTICKFFRQPEAKTNEPDQISGTKDAVSFLCGNGYDISKSLFEKKTATGDVPCKRFHNRRLLFSKKQLLKWAESKCKSVGQSDAALTLAKSANRKLRNNVKH